MPLPIYSVSQDYKFYTCFVKCRALKKTEITLEKTLENSFKIGIQVLTFSAIILFVFSVLVFSKTYLFLVSCSNTFFRVDFLYSLCLICVECIMCGACVACRACVA